MIVVSSSFIVCGIKAAMYNARIVSKLLHKRTFRSFVSTACHYDKRDTNAKSTVIMTQHCNSTERSVMFFLNAGHNQILNNFRTFHTCENARQCTTVEQNAHSCRTCWNCGRDTSPVRELFFCDCGVVQKPASELTYFELMQLKPTFDINTKNLGDMFREMQKKLHPDKFTSKSQEERNLAQQQSALLNRAYNTLQKPLSRAVYLLSLHNIDISEKDGFSEPEFLMEIMEVNEQISSAKQSSDVEAVERSNDAKIAECVKEISNLFKKELLTDVKKITIKLRYYTTIQERIFELKRSEMG